MGARTTRTAGSGDSERIDEGTLCRQSTPVPGTAGASRGRRFECGFNEADREMLIMSRDEWMAVILTLNATIKEATSPVKDALDWGQVMKQVGLDAKVIDRTYNGRDYVIVTGKQGLRSILKGRWYRADNPTIVRMAIGTVGRLKSAIKGTALTIVLIGVADYAEAALSDDAALKELLGYTMAVDVAKAAVGTIAAAVAGALLAASTAPVWLVIGSAIVVGLVIGKVLDSVAPTDVFARRLQAMIDAVMASGGAMLDELERDIKRAIMQQSAMFPRY